MEMLPVVSPLQGLDFLLFAKPRALPWAGMRRPDGAEEVVGGWRKRWMVGGWMGIM